MSDPIKHECGIGFLRLRKPLNYYTKTYNNALWGLNKLYLLMEKQHNRGQDGAGIASLKINHEAGKAYLRWTKSTKSDALKYIFKEIMSEMDELYKVQPELINDGDFLKREFDYSGELIMGHVRYGTHGDNTIDTCHPFERSNNWKTKNLLLSGNFNLTNVDEIIEMLIENGQHPKDRTDTVTVLENIGYYLDEQNDALYHQFKEQGLSKRKISEQIAEQLDIAELLSSATKRWDGGYTIQGAIGHGDAFVMRDKNGIRPAFYYVDDEYIVAASERSAIATVFNIEIDSIKEIDPGHALIVKRNGDWSVEKYIEPGIKKACSFERIYFSRGSDIAIYNERKMLGKLLIPQILSAIDNDLENTVFSYIPNTAETAFMGLIEGLDEKLSARKNQKILDLSKKGDLSESVLKQILNQKIRVEKAAIKDVKLRTFITDDSQRNDMVAHVYDTTYGILKKDVDNLVVIDDSIVRGTTLRESIIRILYRLNPKQIIIVSSAPQIRYPDCYGIDMSNLNKLIAFNAAIELLRENDCEHVIQEVYEQEQGAD